VSYARVPYVIYQWLPPTLTPEEELWLGGEISRLGFKTFSSTLKSHACDTQKSGFTLNDVINFCEKINDWNAQNKSRSTSPRDIIRAVPGLAVLFGLLWLGWKWAFNTFPSLLDAAKHLWFPAVLAGAFSFGTMFWTRHKIDRWCQALVIKYFASLSSETDRDADFGPEASAMPDRLRDVKAAMYDPFEIAGGEVLSGNVKASLWARALVEGNGNDVATRASYVKLRVADLQRQSS
jgi:hypothetical protein